MCFYNMTQNTGHSMKTYLPSYCTQSTVSKILTPCEYYIWKNGFGFRLGNPGISTSSTKVRICKWLRIRKFKALLVKVRSAHYQDEYHQGAC